MLPNVLHDLRLAVRGLRRSKSFTLAAVGSLGPGIALMAATLGLAQAYAVSSMPYPAAERLYRVRYSDVGQPEPRGVAGLAWDDVRDVVEIADASAGGRFFLGDGLDKAELQGLAVASASLEMLGVRAQLGRSLVPDDFVPEAEQVALISQAMWRDRFGAANDALGRMVRVHRQSPENVAEAFRVVGVLPPDFRYARDPSRGALDLVIPLKEQQRSYMVRLRAGVPVALAEGRITDVVRATATSLPPNWPGVRLESVHQTYVAAIRPALTALFAAAILVILIVCLNLAMLLLLRSVKRQKEIAVRVALGASRRHIVRLFGTEAAVIAGLGLAAGLVLAGLTLGTLAPIMEERFQRAAPGGTSTINLNGMVLLPMLALGLLITIMLSGVPLLAPWSRRLGETLRRSGRTGTGARSTRRLEAGLVVLEVALSFALLVGCGLMTRTVMTMLSTDLGFRIRQIERARIALPQRRYPDPPAMASFYAQLEARLAEQTDLSFAFATVYPFYEPPDQAAETQDGQRTDADVFAVSGSYFGLLDITISRGRAFTPADNLTATPVAVISQAMADRLWPGEDPIGRGIRVIEPTGEATEGNDWRTVVGVASNVRQTHRDTETRDIYVPFLQAPGPFVPFYVRTAGTGVAWLDQVRAAVAAIDPGVLAGGYVTASPSLSSEADRQLAGPRFLTYALLGFAAFAVLLALTGLYGVTAAHVQQREREIAIRMALGANRPAVISLFLRQGSLLLTGGLALGLIAAVATGRILGSQLFGVGPLDPVTLLVAAAVLLGAGLLAIWSPVNHGTLRDPLHALGED